MSAYVIQGATLTGIADAIRTQLGTQQQYTPESMAAAIVNIQGSGDTEIEDALISRNISGVYKNDRVSSIGGNAFKSCTALIDVSFPQATEIGDSSFSTCSALAYVYAPKAQTLASSAFYSCRKMAIFYFGSLTRISSNVFVNVGGDSENASLILDGDGVCELVSSTSFLNFLGTVYVPDSLAEQYKVATNWSTIADKIKGKSEIPAEVQEWLDQRQGGASA